MFEENRILIVEDDATIRKVVEMTLALAGFRNVIAVARGDAGLAIARAEDVDLVLLDLMLPGMDGLDVCRELRKTKSTPVIVLTAKTADEDTVRLLDAGADDYITKPFSRQVLLSRIKAVLRRASGGGAHDLDGLAIDVQNMEARLDGVLVDLTRGEFLTLAALAERPGRIMRRERLARAAGAADDIFDEEEIGRSVDVRIASIRRKLGRWAVHLQTIRGAGYRIGL
ncbi:MAG: response regulator transcription factor [Kiritimatiellae bacterium]|nr:response regulator transcription factor [Kiritimatiellia bacterium]